MPDNSFEHNNIDYQLQILRNNTLIDITPGKDKYDITVKVSKSTTFNANNFEIFIYNLPGSIAKQIEKPRLRSSGSARIFLQAKGNASNTYYEIINKEAVEITSVPIDKATTLQTRIYGYAGSALLNGIFNLNLRDSTTHDAIRTLANNAGMNIEDVTSAFSPIKNERLDIVLGHGTGIQHLHRLSQYANNSNVKLFIDNNKIVTLENNRYRKRCVVDSYNLKETPFQSSNIIPVRMFLYPEVNVGGMVDIRDQLNTSVSGIYTAVNCTHSFEYFRLKKTTGSTNVDLLAYNL